jgi:Carboxypeptidase regulatory-like domain
MIHRKENRTMKKYLLVVMVLCLGLVAPAFAQQQSTTGSIEGRVLDPQGAAVPGAKVTVTGPRGSTEIVTDGEGLFEVRNLDPGNYAVSIEMQGFKTAKIERTEVVLGKANTITANLELGPIGEVVEVTDVAQIDQSSTAVGQNLNDQLYQNIPVQRTVSSLFYLSPSAGDSLGGGRDNPSISGGSALDNLYIADGVNITDSAFGGIGTFTRNYGSLGTGINTSFIKEVQVKSGGFEPQYGQSTGGIINIVTKSGGNEFSGAVYGYARPNAFEAERRQRDEFSVNKFGASPASFGQLAQEQYDVGVDFSGPIVKDKLFFFGSFNPSIIRDIVRGARRNQFELENGTGRDSGLYTLLGEHHQRYRTLNYALKIDYTLNANHTLNFSVFGDPSKTNRSSFATLNIDNTTAFAQLDYGTQNASVRYNGAFGSNNPATLSINFSRGHNHYNEFGFDNLNAITDRTQPTRGNFIAVGYGFFEPTDGTTYRLTMDGTKQASFLGSHTFGIGYQYQRGFYSGLRERSGPRYPFTQALADAIGGAPPGAVGSTLNATFSLFSTDAIQENPAYPFALIPGRGFRRVYLRQDRGEYGDTNFETQSNYHAAYIQDTWRFNKYITAIVGLRWEQEQIVGSPLGAPEVQVINDTNGENLAPGFRSSYTFTGQFSPRIGVTIDPRGQGKTKIFYNFGRYHEYLPLDAAERSLSVEKDYFFSRFSPVTVACDPAFGLPAGSQCAVRNEFGSVIPQLSAESLIAATGFFSQNDPTRIVNPGTKLGFADEHVVGFEQQLPRNFTFSARYLDRRIKRIIEDGAYLSPEAALAGIGQTYFLGNINAALDAGANLLAVTFAPQFGVFNVDGHEVELITNTPANCVGDAVVTDDGQALLQPTFFTNPTDVFGNLISPGGVCYGGRGIDLATGLSINRPDGTADGFADPVRIYRAIEVELNKRFSDNWQLLSNVRFASLRGNYEGHLRNDNGQTDPGISSLFDFTAGDFNLLGDQFAVGPLNSDRRVTANIYGSYTLGKDGFGSRLSGMTLGVNLHGESGIPISEFYAHPAYANQGEIPVGGRGKLGRTSPYYRLDLHVDYPWQITENSRLSFIADFFNVTNNTPINRVNEFRETTAGQLNPDFLAPRWFYQPFNMRLGMRLEF